MSVMAVCGSAKIIPVLPGTELPAIQARAIAGEQVRPVRPVIGAMLSTPQDCRWDITV